jgi:glycosyltransferase involved in cell wall biosynthesis
MKIVIDAMGAPSRSGGMKVHAEEFIEAWLTAHDDEVVLVGYPWLAQRFSSRARVAIHSFPESNAGRRFITQFATSWRIARATNADALLSLSSIVSPLAGRHLVTGCFIHDWRHIASPGEFSFSQRVLRRLWKLSIRHADFTFAISSKTFRETREIVKARRLVLAENGGDHPARWSESSVERFEAPTILAFGHLPNKRPELVVRAIADLAARNVDARAVVIGTKEQAHESLRRLISDLGVSDRVDLPGFVSDSELQGLMQGVDVVAVISSDEGYGFPVVEAHYFGKRVLVAADGGLAEIHGDLVSVVEPEPAAIADAIFALLASEDHAPSTQIHQWSDTVGVVRRCLSERVVFE